MLLRLSAFYHSKTPTRLSGAKIIGTEHFQDSAMLLLKNKLGSLLGGKRYQAILCIACGMQDTPLHCVCVCVMVCVCVFCLYACVCPRHPSSWLQKFYSRWASHGDTNSARTPQLGVSSLGDGFSFSPKLLGMFDTNCFSKMKPNRESGRDHYH